jgi:hypothetical protein
MRMHSTQTAKPASTIGATTARSDIRNRRE